MKTLIAGALTIAAVTAGTALPAAAQYGGYYAAPGRPIYAQPRYGEPVYGRRYLVERPLGPRYLDDRLSSRMLSIVARDRGIERIDRIRDGGDIYIVDGVDMRGQRVRATFDAYDGTLIDRRRLDGLVAEPSRPNRRSTAKLAEPPARTAPAVKPAAPSAKPAVVVPQESAPAVNAPPVAAPAAPAAVNPARASIPNQASRPGEASAPRKASNAPAVAATPRPATGGTGSAEEVAKAVESSKAWAVPVAPAEPATGGKAD